MDGKYNRLLEIIEARVQNNQAEVRLVVDSVLKPFSAEISRFRCSFDVL